MKAIRASTLLLLCTLLAPTVAHAQAGAGSSDAAAEEDRGREGVEMVGHVLKPIPVEWSAERMAG